LFRTLILAAAVASMSAPAAFAEEQAEEFLLGDVGVRIDLPKGWEMSRWSDWDFKAKSKDGKMKLEAWATPVQQAVLEADVEAWSAVHTAKVLELNGSEPEVQGTSFAETSGIGVARSEVAFTFAGDMKGVLISATVPVEGQMFHMSLLTAAQRVKKAQQIMDGLVERLEVRSPMTTTASGAKLELDSISSTLPEGWRPVLSQEQSVVTAASKSLVEDLEGCWSAIRPRPGGEPDVMFTCPGGPIMDIGLGLVDEASFAEVEEKLRPRLFGPVPVEAASRVELEGRSGFVYRTDIGPRSLSMGVVPYGEGVARTWAVGTAGTGTDLGADVEALLLGSAYEGDHMVTVSERFSYALSYNPTSPIVMGPGLVLLLLAGGAIFLATRERKDKYADLLED
jgi:hypothetical protein